MSAIYTKTITDLKQLQQQQQQQRERVETALQSQKQTYICIVVWLVSRWYWLPCVSERWSARALTRPLLFQTIVATFILLLNSLVLDTMVRQGINTTSPVLDYRGGLHPGAGRPGAGHDGPPGY